MTVSARIEALVTQADALRPLHPDDPKREPLGLLIDEINALRAVQAVPGYVEDDTPAAVMIEKARGKPGRKPKAIAP